MHVTLVQQIRSDIVPLRFCSVSSASLSGNRHGSKSGDRPSWRKRDRATADHLERSPPRIELAGDETATEILKRPELGRHSPDRVTDRSARDGGPSCHGPPRAGELDADFNSPSETITREQAMDEDVSERREVSKTDTGRTRSPPARPAMKTTEKRDVDVGNQSAEVKSEIIRARTEFPPRFPIKRCLPHANSHPLSETRCSAMIR